MESFSIALIYLGFFALVGAACYFTKSATPLFALFLLPSFKWRSGNNKEGNKE